MARGGKGLWVAADGCNQLQPLAATCPSSHLVAATCPSSHLQPLAQAATWQPLAATCSHSQTLAPSGCSNSKWLQAAWASGCQVAASASGWQVAASDCLSKWLPSGCKGLPSGCLSKWLPSGCKWLLFRKSKWCTFARSLPCRVSLYQLYCDYILRTGEGGRSIAFARLGGPSSTADRVTTWIILQTALQLVHPSSTQGAVERLGVRNWLCIHQAANWSVDPSHCLCFFALAGISEGSGGPLAWTLPQWSVRRSEMAEYCIACRRRWRHWLCLMWQLTTLRSGKNTGI